MDTNNRDINMIGAQTLESLDGVKKFIKNHRTNHVNMMMNEVIGKSVSMILKRKQTSDTF